jgi:hypothetical protein
MSPVIINCLGLVGYKSICLVHSVTGSFQTASCFIVRDDNAMKTSMAGTTAINLTYPFVFSMSLAAPNPASKKA